MITYQISWNVSGGDFRLKNREMTPSNLRQDLGIQIIKRCLTIMFNIFMLRNHSYFSESHLNKIKILDANSSNWNMRVVITKLKNTINNVLIS